jgi:hypothetical protein
MNDELVDFSFSSWMLPAVALSLAKDQSSDSFYW